MKLYGSGFWVVCLGYGASDSGLKVKVLRFRVQGAGCGHQTAPLWHYRGREISQI